MLPTWKHNLLCLAVIAVGLCLAVFIATTGRP